MDKYLEIALRWLDPVLTLIIGLIAIRVIRKIFKKFLEKIGLDEALHKFLVTGLRCILYIMLIMIMFEKLGIDTKSMITFLGVAGGAIALALKDSLSNVAGGLIILVTKPFSKGDHVDINGTDGTVENIDLMLTTLVTFDNKTITIPNGLVSSAVITNFTKADHRRVDCLFSISYDSDVKKAKEIMAHVASQNEAVLEEPPMVMGVLNNGESAVNLEFKVWTKTEDYWDVKYYLEENVKLAFDKNGIVMPYRQVDVNVKNQ